MQLKVSVETAIGLALPDGVVVCGKINMLSQEGELTRVPVSVGQAHINNAFVFEWITESLDMDKEQITLQLSSVKAGETTPVDLFQLPVTEVPSIRSVLELGEAGEPSVHHLKGMMTPVHVTLRVCLTGEEVVDYRFVSVTARYIKNLDASWISNAGIHLQTHLGDTTVSHSLPVGGIDADGSLLNLESHHRFEIGDNSDIISFTLVRDHHSSLATVQFDLKGGLEAEPVIEGELALHDSDRQLICHLGIRFEGWSLDEYVGEFDRRATEIESAAAAATSRGHESDITTALKRVATLRPQLGQAEYPGDAQRIVDALSGFEFLTSRSKTPSSTKRAKSPPATASSPPTASPPTASPPTASPPIMTPPVPQEPPIRPRGPHSVPREYWLVHHSYEVCRSRWRRLLDDPGLGECLAGDRQALALMDEAEKHWKQVKRTLPVATNFRDTCLGFGDELSLNHSDRRSFIALFYCLVEERVRIQHYAL